MKKKITRVRRVETPLFLIVNETRILGLERFYDVEQKLLTDGGVKPKNVSSEKADEIIGAR